MVQIINLGDMLHGLLVRVCMGFELLLQECFLLISGSLLVFLLGRGVGLMSKPLEGA